MELKFAIWQLCPCRASCACASALGPPRSAPPTPEKENWRDNEGEGGGGGGKGEEKGRKTGRNIYYAKNTIYDPSPSYNKNNSVTFKIQDLNVDLPHEPVYHCRDVFAFWPSSCPCSAPGSRRPWTVNHWIEWDGNKFGHISNCACCGTWHV